MPLGVGKPYITAIYFVLFGWKRRNNQVLLMSPSEVSLSFTPTRCHHQHERPPVCTLQSERGTR